MPDHDDGEPLVDEAAEEEEHEDAPMIPNECAFCRGPVRAAHGFQHLCSSWACVKTTHWRFHGVAVLCAMLIKISCSSERQCL